MNSNYWLKNLRWRFCDKCWLHILVTASAGYTYWLQSFVIFAFTEPRHLLHKPGYKLNHHWKEPKYQRKCPRRAKNYPNYSHFWAQRWLDKDLVCNCYNIHKTIQSTNQSYNHMHTHTHPTQPTTLEPTPTRPIPTPSPSQQKPIPVVKHLATQPWPLKIANQPPPRLPMLPRILTPTPCKAKTLV